MEQFDTDEKFIENSKDKEPKTSSIHCLIILFCCIFALCLIFFLFKYIKKPNQEQDKTFVNQST